MATIRVKDLDVIEKLREDARLFLTQNVQDEDGEMKETLMRASLESVIKALKEYGIDGLVFDEVAYDPAEGYIHLLYKGEDVTEPCWIGKKAHTLTADGKTIYACRFVDIDEDGNYVLTEDGSGRYLITVLEDGTVIARDVITTAAEDVSYDNANYPDCKDIGSAIDMILSRMDYVAPVINSFTMTPSAAQYEIGTVVSSLAFAWVLNKAVTSVVFDGETLDASATSKAYSKSLSSNKQFTLTVGDGKNTASATKGVSFLPTVYYGSSAAGTYNSAFVLALENKVLKSSRAGNYTLDVADGEYGFICIPARYGTPVVTIGGFTTELETVATIDHKNASGYTESYVIYKTSQTGLGSITMVIT